MSQDRVLGGQRGHAYFLSNAYIFRSKLMMLLFPTLGILILYTLVTNAYL